jgi:RNA polymerase sigma-70 factor (ECF subfamily)
LHCAAGASKNKAVKLAAAFLPHVSSGREALAADSSLEPTLAALVEAAESAWPDVKLSRAAFLRFLAERFEAGERDPVAALAKVHAADLYVTCGCVEGDVRALAGFERRFLPPISSYLSRKDSLSGFTDDVKQALRTRLLLRGDRLLPRLASYNGRGPLGGWLRMVATRIAVDLRREAGARDGHRADGELASSLRAPTPDPELDYLKLRYRKELQAAIRSTLAALDARGANVLRLHFLDGMTIGAIATVYRVSWRSVHRWLTEARTRILTETRQLLAGRLRLSSTEIDSLMDLAGSQLEVSLHRLLDKPRRHS